MGLLEGPIADARWQQLHHLHNHLCAQLAGQAVQRYHTRHPEWAENTKELASVVSMVSAVGWQLRMMWHVQGARQPCAIEGQSIVMLVAPINFRL